MFDSVRSPREWTGATAADNLPAGCGFGLLFGLVTAWTSVQAVTRYRAYCGVWGSAADALSLASVELPLMAVGYTAVFALVYATVRPRVAEVWPAFSSALAALGVAAVLGGLALAATNRVPAGLCTPVRALIRAG